MMEDYIQLAEDRIHLDYIYMGVGFLFIAKDYVSMVEDYKIGLRIF